MFPGGDVLGQEGIFGVIAQECQIGGLIDVGCEAGQVEDA